MNVGVHNHKSIIDFSGVSDYFKESLKKQKESYPKRERRTRLPKRILESRLSRFSEAITQLDEQSWGDEDCFKNLTATLSEFARIEECPEDFENLFYFKVEIRDSSGRPRKTRVRRRKVPPLFGSRIIPEVNDVISVDKKHVSKEKWLFDIVTIKKDGLSKFNRLLEWIPPIKKQKKSLKQKKRFSARYTFRPYPLATELWLRDAASIVIHSDLKSFLQGAIRYIFSAEWRTPIVLSAITVESVLADLYEEKFQENAPDTPLGDLFRQVKAKIDFPQEIVNAIDMTNKSRIAAVHRSRFPVSDREAVNALYGATNFTLWYSSEF